MNELAIKNPATGLYEISAGHFPVSNGVWDNASLRRIREAKGDTAVVIGSGNVPNIAPLIDGLSAVCFADWATGHEDVFEAKRRAVELGYRFEDDPQRSDLQTMMGQDFEYKLRLEAKRFDLTRPTSPLHVINNPKSAEVFLECADRLATSSAEIDLTKPDSVSALPDELGRVAWVHISNVVPFSLSAYSTDDQRDNVLAGVAGFLGLIPGIETDTSVSYSRYTYFGHGLYELVVEVVDYKDLDIEVLPRDAVRGDSTNDDIELAV